MRPANFHRCTFLLCGLFVVGQVQAQETVSPPTRAATAEIKLRKSVVVRQFQGREISGEERQIGRGDSLWRILIEEKGLADRKFHSYLVVIRGLNPQVKNLDVLRAGDKIFIPLNLGDEDENLPGSKTAAAEAVRPGSGRTVDYQVRAGEHLYRILRDRYKSADERKLAQYYSLVQDLNPERKNWDILVEGEIIRLPADQNSQIATASEIKSPPAPKLPAPAPEVATESAPKPKIAPAKPEVSASGGGKSQPAAGLRPPGPVSVGEPTSGAKVAPARPLDIEQTMRSAARHNIHLLVRVAEATGSEVQSSGEEVIQLPDGDIRLDKSVFPVIYNASIGQRVVVDPDGKIPASLKAKFNDPRVGTVVLPMSNGLSVADAGRQLLSAIGYLPLPDDRPVVVQEAGITFEAKGNWMALAPVVSNKAQEVLVINLTEHPNEIPLYLTTALAKQGLSFRDVVLARQASSMKPARPQSLMRNFGPAKELPKDKSEIVDALLLSFRIPFGVAENVSVELRDGLRMETKLDRLFELEGRRTAILFRRIDPLVRQALQDRHATKVAELDIQSLSSREVISGLLSLLGDHAVYSEHRFAAVEGPIQDRLTLKAWGFNLKQKQIFLTDRQIPSAFQRFFFEKGLDIVYFR